MLKQNPVQLSFKTNYDTRVNYIESGVTKTKNKDFNDCFEALSDMKGNIKTGYYVTYGSDTYDIGQLFCPADYGTPYGTVNYKTQLANSDISGSTDKDGNVDVGYLFASLGSVEYVKLDADTRCVAWFANGDFDNNHPKNIYVSVYIDGRLLCHWRGYVAHGKYDPLQDVYISGKESAINSADYKSSFGDVSDLGSNNFQTFFKRCLDRFSNKLKYQYSIGDNYFGTDVRYTKEQISSKGFLECLDSIPSASSYSLYTINIKY